MPSSVRQALDPRREMELMFPRRLYRLLSKRQLQPPWCRLPPLSSYFHFQVSLHVLSGFFVHATPSKSFLVSILRWAILKSRLPLLRHDHRASDSRFLSRLFGRAPSRHHYRWGTVGNTFLRTGFTSTANNVASPHRYHGQRQRPNSWRASQKWSRSPHHRASRRDGQVRARRSTY